MKHIKEILKMYLVLILPFLILEGLFCAIGFYFKIPFCDKIGVIIWLFLFTRKELVDAYVEKFYF